VKNLIIVIVQSIVDRPEEVSVNETTTEHTSVLELSVAKSDLGKVIGKQGRMAKAIRTIVSATSGRAQKRYMLEIME
jgi:predicted RNA-binding protein YlqC (UPF0109 family)